MPRSSSDSKVHPQCSNASDNPPPSYGWTESNHDFQDKLLLHKAPFWFNAPVERWPLWLIPLWLVASKTSAPTPRYLHPNPVIRQSRMSRRRVQAELAYARAENAKARRKAKRKNKPLKGYMVVSRTMNYHWQISADCFHTAHAWATAELVNKTGLGYPETKKDLICRYQPHLAEAAAPFRETSVIKAIDDRGGPRDCEVRVPFSHRAIQQLADEMGETDYVIVSPATPSPRL